MKLPAFQFYPGDWRKDPGIQALDYETRGIWLEMLCLMHESDERGVLLLNGNPMPDEALARVLGLDKQNLTTALSKIEAYGVASRRVEDNAIMSRRMVRDENLRKVRAEAGKQGGNPSLLKQNPTTGVKQNPTPSSSSSSSESVKDAVDALRLELGGDLSSPPEDIKAMDRAAKIAAFALFWNQYPNKAGKKKALEVWLRIGAANCFEAVMIGLRRAIGSEQWMREGGRYIPHPTTWLNREGWHDELPSAANGNGKSFLNGGTGIPGTAGNPFL